MPTPEKTRPRGRRFQFTIRSLLLATALIALWLGWLTDRAARQRKAVQTLEAHGAELFYDDRLVDSPVFSFSLSGWDQYYALTGRNWSHQHFSQDADGNWCAEDSTDQCAWEWLPRWADKDYFRVLRGVMFHKGSDAIVMRDDLRALSRVGSVKWLALDGFEDIGDEHLDYIARLTRLERLYLARTAVSDAGLRHLSGLANLRYLSLAGTGITDAGLTHLRSLGKLEMLELCETAVSDAGIVELNRLKKLGNLYLYKTRVTKKGLEQLRTELPKCLVTLEWPGCAQEEQDDSKRK